ncbi:hypothetical protein H9Y04_25095 [Streptomyces sp. TRM66268-LWL]|uniref:DNA-directed RNA polymerase specialized sigma24 family protein n=1 Tax=Streptomyces polyasparticus TaxID=2767826 RepID=A0ABR7SK30_9ACTN|nr:hypothetical protein [Streptomyces polyasparticus]MBC9715822.1 hypothetical protein [Streptomyces polyasparticus]
MFTLPRRTRPVDHAEAHLVDQYTRLVSLAYLVLPASLSRHRRVLLAHGIAQRALPRTGRIRGTRHHERVPQQRGDTGGGQSVGDQLRERVLRAALDCERRPRGWPKRLPPPRTVLTWLPVVWGLRLFPRAGGAEELALGAKLAHVPAATRAAFVLRHLEGLADSKAGALLAAAGVADPRRALRASHRLDATAGASAETLLRSQEFDACSVQTRPTDLLRRRRRFGLLWAVTAVVAVLVVLATALGGDDTEPSAAALPTGAAGPDQLVRVGGDVWADTSRVDFTAWPPRGDRTRDEELLTRALATWAAPPQGTRIAKSPGTTAQAPTGAPQLLYAGEVDGQTVAVFHEGQRLVRYSERDGEAATLDFARADDSDVTTAAAVALTRGGNGTRYLLAPWIAEAERRDLLRPDTPARALEFGKDGITEPAAVPSPGGSCDAWPVLQLRSSDRIVEKHAFLVTDLGGLTPAHLSYTPLPGQGAPARQPREATSTNALTSWATTACRLDEFRDDGVRAVNVWDFAEQDLPERGGQAVWSCARATTWRGPGQVLLQFKARSAGPAPVVGRAAPTAACSRFGQHVLATAQWVAPSGARYLLAAGSRQVTSLKVSGAVDATVQGRTLARRIDSAEVRPKVRARLANGSTLKPVAGTGNIERADG